MFCFLEANVGVCLLMFSLCVHTYGYAGAGQNIGERHVGVCMFVSYSALAMQHEDVLYDDLCQRSPEDSHVIFPRLPGESC